MRETYIYLSQEDKAKLFKQAYAKQLSVSTYANIIINNYYIFVENEKPLKEYYKKGNQRIKLKLKNEIKCFKFTNMIATNCIYFFLHNEDLKKYMNTDIDFMKNANKKIQSESDKTTDINFDLNRIIRATYTANKRLQRA